MYTMVMVGSSIAPALIGRLIDALGFEVAFSIITLVAFAGAALVLFIRPVKNENT
jgi:FSR family fosmidomycin resistance protein-like MFS transporter